MAITVSVAPLTPTINHGATQQFTATVLGFSSVNTVTWSIVSGPGSINGSGLFTAAASGATVVKATSVEDNTKNAQTTITTATVALSVLPASPTVLADETLQLTAPVTGAANTAVTWSKTSGNGTVSAGGLFTAGLVGSDVITATSVEDGTKTASVTITVAHAAAGARKVHLTDDHSSFLQHIVLDYLNKLDRTSAEYTKGKAAFAALASSQV